VTFSKRVGWGWRRRGTPSSRGGAGQGRARERLTDPGLDSASTKPPKARGNPPYASRWASAGLDRGDAVDRDLQFAGLTRNRLVRYQFADEGDQCERTFTLRGDLAESWLA